MGHSYETVNEDEPDDHGRKIIKQSPYQFCSMLSSSWFQLRVFYVRISNCEVDNSTPEYLTLNHIPLSPETHLEVNGVRSSIYSEGISSLLRRDRADKKSEEVTFVSTDRIMMIGSVKFDIHDKDKPVLSGILEMSNCNGSVDELKSKSHGKQWSMSCESKIVAGTGFLKGKQYVGPELLSPTIDVYVAGCFSGTPIILTKTLQLSFRKKHRIKGMLDSIPENETTECEKDNPSELAFQISEYQKCKPETIKDYDEQYTGAEYLEGYGGEFSWFNAGVRVGVGISLGVCLGLGIGVGFLVCTYQATTRSFKRRLL